jgi:hypothetical protein
VSTSSLAEATFVAARRTRDRTRRGRWVDAAPEARNTSHQQRFAASSNAIAARGGRSVDAEARTRRHPGKRTGLFRRTCAKPSDGLEPSTPSLPLRLNQPVAAGGNGFRLFPRFTGLGDLPLIATRCNHGGSIKAPSRLCGCRTFYLRRGSAYYVVRLITAMNLCRFMVSVGRLVSRSVAASHRRLRGSRQSGDENRQCLLLPVSGSGVNRPARCRRL